MMTAPGSFNTNFFFALLLGLTVFGCKTTEPEKKHGKEASTLRLHLEMPSDGTQHMTAIPIYRENPVYVSVNREPFLTEIDLDLAAVVNVMGGFAIQVQFNRHGTLVLDSITTAHKGRRIGVLTQFTESRWLAAPLINRRITDGILVFTPDATQEEAERIVRGLNNLIAEVKKKSKY